MAKFNTVTKTGVTSPIKTTTKTVNSDGFASFARDAKSELFLLAVSNMVAKDAFYESAKNRDDRFSQLCKTNVITDPKWFLGFVSWLRNDAFMRSASIVAAAEAAQAYLPFAGDDNYDVTFVKRLVAASMARADEPGEFLAYWSTKYGKNFPAAVKKGVELAAQKLYNEYSLLKYDTDSKGFRFADVIQLSHAQGKDSKQNELFKYALDRRFGNDVLVANETSLELILTNSLLMNTAVESRRHLLNAASLKKAGMTWESLSGWLQGPMDKAAWEAIIPNMGYMALLRNLRNFQQAKVSQKVLNGVLATLSDPAEVAKSKQFPFRFLAAYNANKGNLKISAALETALEASLSNVPELKGKTLILVDRSGSMYWSNDKNSDLTFADQAAIFGSALALRAENATLVQYGTSSAEIRFRKGDSVLPLLERFTDMGGTATNAAIQKHFKDHDRVIIITDEQYNSGRAPLVPAKTPMYTWNLGGYTSAHAESGNAKRHTWGGLTDKGFQMIPLIEAGQSQNWPWEVAK